MAWVRENFADFEVAVVYHDDNAGRIPHAHVVVNNTNVSNLRRLQDPDPRALKRSAQRLAKDMGLSYLKDAPKGAAAPPRRTLQRTYVRRAEAELSRRGLYSWVADIRMRIEVARAVAHDEADFRSLLSEMDVAVADNSPRAQRRDWVYSLVDAATLMRAYDDADDLGPRAVSAHAYLEALLGDGGTGDPEEEICRRMGMTTDTWREIGAVQAAIAASRTNEGEDFGD